MKSPCVGKSAVASTALVASLLGAVLVALVEVVPCAQAVIPADCVHNVTRHHVCCPFPKGSFHRCGGPGVGHCGRVQIFRDKVPAVFALDDRVHWPTKFFQYLCICEGNHFGVACEECWHGWEGPGCRFRQKKPFVRQNWLHLSPRKKAEFLKVMHLSFHEPSGYMIMIEQENWRSDPIRSPIFTPANVHYFMVVLHRFAARATLYDTKDMCDKYGVLDFNHDGAGFVTWHRYFMMYWERALQRIAKKYLGVLDFTIPYWNWADSTHCEICTNDMAGAEGPIDRYGQRLHPHSIFYNWTEYCSEPLDEPTCFGCHYSGHFAKITRHWNTNKMPTTDDIDYVMSLKTFYIPTEKDGSECKSFHMAVEGFCGPPGSDDSRLWMHNYVHNCVDGTMCCSAPATTDPLFLVHHTEVDRQVEAWLRDNKPPLIAQPNDGVRPGHCRECAMVGFLPPVRHTHVFRSSLEMGYTYDSFVFGRRGRVYGMGRNHGITKWRNWHGGGVPSDAIHWHHGQMDIGSAATARKKK